MCLPYLSPGDIAVKFRVPKHRVEYVIRAKGIPAAGRAGNCRVFAEDAVQRIGAELQRIAEAHAGVRVLAEGHDE